MQVEGTEDGLRAVDAAKHSVDVRADGWSDGADTSAPSLSAAIDALDLGDAWTPDATVSGSVESLGFPPVYAPVRDVDTGEVFDLGSGTGPLTIPEGRYALYVESRIDVYVRFDGAATIEKPRYERLHVRFPEETAVEIGFGGGVTDDPETVTVPATPDGVATALSTFPAGHRTATADRSFDSMRGVPPKIAFGDAVSIPDTLRERRDDAGVRVVVPPDLDHLFVASPLAHYVGAEVVVEPDARPRVETPGGTHSLPRLPEFQDAVASLLERAFYLDCVVRDAGPYGSGLSVAEVTAELGLDSGSLYAASPGERLDAYLATAFESVRDRFPEWHLSMSIEPTYEHVPTLSHLLANVPHVRVAESTTLAESEWLDTSLSDFYRRDVGEVASVELVQPELGRARTHGWLADGVPIDAFKTVPEAYENRARYLDAAGEPISIVAILNDGDMREEHDGVAAHYRERAEALDLDLTLKEHLTVDELASVFESRTDLVHYIGHCEREGLRCTDGYLSASSLSASNAQTFFLNACGSFHEGIELIRKGSVAGAVTFSEVLDGQAATVGTMFARLLVTGYCMERALDKSRRQIMTGKDYAVVGDGTHVLTQSEDIVGTDVRVTEAGPDRFDVTVTMGAPWMAGGFFRPYLQEGDETHLLGARSEFTVGRAELVEFLSYADKAVLFDGALRWSDVLAEELRES
ncbi:hypothetical protein [Halobaculum magnesiiphilum]|uniref:CHAT domain-containing protein n=1 Tax=Halobaculum magnesiiphilum TaxID=1017351 RepID=A0A8T8WDL8_9EURY|nr:hypothetical protein [Halobaculum magnesiiphilum]QZP37931.1 hypothetical protein K6T50_01785 [Halobaculum magnesiiphilum]